MSKAFVKEDQEEIDNEEETESSLPSGVKNYITPPGFKKLKEELNKLLCEERPALTQVIAWAAGNGDRSENADYIYGKRRLREIDRRIRFLTKRLEQSEIVDPLRQKEKNGTEKVFFGATVTVCDEENEVKTFTIVGVDEINLEKNRISWISPLARALLQKELGEVVQFRAPKGIRELEIVKIEYIEP